MRVAAAHGLGYERIPSASKLFFANSETTSVQQALNVWFPTKPPMLIVVEFVEQGRVPNTLLLAADEEPQHEIGHVARRSSGNLRGLGPPSCTGGASIVITHFN